MIAYVGKDRDDALSVGTIDSFDVFSSSFIGQENAQIINNLTVDIVNQSYGSNKIAMSKEAFKDLKQAKRQNYELIYEREGMIGNTSNIVEEMFTELYDRLLTDLIRGDESSPVFKHHCARLTAKSFSLTLEEYLKTDPNQIIVDYIASMTDSYFVALHAYLFPDDKKSLAIRGYCANLSSASK